MRLVRPFMVIIVLLVIGGIASHVFRTAAQQNKALYQVMLTMDTMTFMTGGGGSFDYDNYFKWCYATWRKSPERTWREKILFWDTGFFYDASNPPKEYEYPPRFKN